MAVAQEGGGDRGKLEFSGGASGDRWSTVYALQYEKWDPIFASQRDFLADTRRGPLGSVTNPALSLIAIIFSAAFQPSALNFMCFSHVAGIRRH